MISFNDFTDSYDLDLLSVLSGIEGVFVEYGDGTLTIESPDFNVIQSAVSKIKGKVDYEVFSEDSALEDGTNVFISGYVLIIYTDNLSLGGFPGTDQDELITEAKRIIKVNAKGKRTIKVKCKPGFKFTGSSCQRISGSERMNKRKGLKKAILTKKSKGSGAKRKTARLSRIAKTKRKRMGL